MPPSRIDVFYRLGSVGDKELFEELSKRYFGVIIDAHTAAFYNLFVHSFLQKIKKPFFIDPQTYRFARDVENIKRGEDMRKSFVKLVEWYGPSLSSVLSQRQLIPKDFDDTFVRLLAEKTISFQTDLLKTRTASQQSISKYAKILSEEAAENVPQKAFFLVAPYFHFSSTEDPWYQISRRVALESLELRGSQRMFAVLSFPEEILLGVKTEFDRIANDYRDFDGYLLWISGFSEEKAGGNFLQGLYEFLQSLSNLGKPIYMLYGGYFSALLCKIVPELHGFGRGICYGEGKDVDALMPIGGGAPARYYFSLTKTKLSEALARTIFTAHSGLLCGCDTCRVLAQQIDRAHPQYSDVQKVSTFFDSLNFTMSKQHFIMAHSEEITSLEKMKSLEEVKQDLLAKSRLCEKLDLSNVFGVPSRHLQRWREVLRDDTFA